VARVLAGMYICVYVCLCYTCMYVCVNASIYVQHGCGIAGDLALQASGSNVARMLAGMYVCMYV
jgi:hypothetical protein